MKPESQVTNPPETRLLDDSSPALCFPQHNKNGDYGDKTLNPFNVKDESYESPVSMGSREKSYDNISTDD